MMDIRQAEAEGYVWIWQEVQTSVANGATVYIAWKTGDSAVVIDFAQFATTADAAEYTLYEDNTYTGGTATTSLRKRNRTGVGPAAAPITNAVTGATVTPITANIIGQVVQLKGQVESQTVGSEPPQIIMKPNTEHVLALKNNGAANAGLVARLSFRAYK